MADSDKNILITPNRGSTTDLPKIEFTGADPNTITLSVLDDATLSFSGASGQLFSISDSLTGTIFSVNDVSGIPSIEVDDDGTVRLAEFAGNLLVGTDVDVGDHKVQIKSDVYNHPLHITSAFGDKIKLTSTHASVQSNTIDFYANDKNTGSVRANWSSNFKEISLGVSFDTDANTQGRRLYIPMTGNPYFRYGGTSDYTVFHDAYHPNADKLTTTRNIALTGAVTGNANFDGSSNISISTTATADPTLTLTGDVTGSATFTNLGNATLTATVANDSHNHYFITSNTPGNAPGNALQYWQASGQGTDYAPTTDWYNTIRGGHGDPNTYYSNTLAMKMTGSYVGTIHTQARSNGTLQGWNQHWHSNNDGPGSGLDADLLDGVDSSRVVYGGNGTATSSITGAALNPSGHLKSGFYTVAGTSSTIPNATSVNFVMHTSYNSEGNQAGFDLAANDSTASSFYLRPATGGGRGAWQTIWTSSNDGPGTGLNADLLDGVQGSSFLRSDADDTASGQYDFTKVSDHAIKVGTLRGTAVGSQTGNFIHMYDRVHIGSPSGWGSRPAPQYGLSTYGGAEFCQDSGDVRIGDTASQTHGGLIINRNGGVPAVSGYSIGNGAHLELLGNNNPILGFHNGGTSACSLYESAGDLYLTRWDGTATGSRLWHSNNDGPGSGLDADLLDGVHASSFNRKDTNTQYLRPYYAYTNYLTTQSANTLSNQMGGDGGIRVDFINGQSFGTWGHCLTWSGYHAYNMYQLAGYYHVNGASDLWFRSEKDHTNDEWTAWNKIYHTGNDGPGSGLDADLLDGIEASTLRDGSLDTNYYVNALYHDEWIRNHYNNNGHYWSTTGWHLYPRDSDDFYIRSGNSSSSALAMTCNTETVRGYFYANSSSQIGTLNSARSWSFKVDNSGNATATGNVTAYSDVRLKEDIKPLENALLTVTKLNGVSYIRKSTGEKEIGFIAQDVKEIVPELVSIVDDRVENTDGTMPEGIEDLHVMKYQNTVALLVEAIKEQQTQIEELSSQLKNLKENN